MDKEKILCEENGYQLIVEEVDGFKENEEIVEVVELEVVEDKVEERELFVEKEKLTEILKRFIKSYCENKKNENLDLKQWLEKDLSREFPEKNSKEIENISLELLDSVEKTQERYEEVEKYNLIGIKSSDCLGEKIEEDFLQYDNPKERLKEVREDLTKGNVESTYKLVAQSGAEVIAGVQAFNKMNRYFSGINETIVAGNEKMVSTLTTKSGAINQNINLDGFIFEQMHENTFNIDVAIKDIIGVRAEALVPEAGASYGKNSVDLVVKIKDLTTGVEKIVKKYQAKLSVTGENADNLYSSGNYKFQRKLYGKGQEDYGHTKVEYGGAESKGVSKAEAKILQSEVQKGNTDVVKQNFKNDVDIKILSKQIGRQALYSGTMAIGLGMGLSVLGKKISGEEVEIEEVVIDGLKAGGIVGISTAVAGGLKTAVEKGIITGVGAKILTNSVVGTMAFSTVSLASTFLSVGNGDLSLKDGLKESGKILASTYAGIKVAGLGVAASAGLVTVGSVLAPVAAIVVGAIGHFVGSEVTSRIYDGVTAVCGEINSTVKSVVNAGSSVVKSVASGVVSGLKSVGSSIISGIKGVASFFGW